MVLFRCVTGGTGGFEIAITTEDTDLYGQTITISKNGSTVGTTVFDNTGNASYTVTETGTYSVSVTYDGRTVTETVEVTAFAVDLAMGFVLEKWLEFGDISGTYASLSDVLADEDAVRQLMTIHAAVDYLASFESTDASVVTILNDNYAAKWISLTDYAMDVLEAAYGTLMGTIGKYGYGEWGITDATTTPPTWGALGNVPVMTSDTAPYGEASASATASGCQPYYPFSGVLNNWQGTSTTNQRLIYKSVNPICVRRITLVPDNDSGTAYNRVRNFKVQGSNDGSTWTDIYSGAAQNATTNAKQVFNFDNDTYYLYNAILVVDTYTTKIGIQHLQFYGRTLKVSVPKMSGNTTPYGEVIYSRQRNTTYAAWKAFDGDKTSSNSSAWIPSEYQNPVGDWVGYHFTSPVVVKACEITNFRAAATSIKDFKVQGSNTGGTNDWHDIATKTNPNTANATTKFTFADNTMAYSYYRILCVTYYGTSGTDHLAICEIQFYGKDYSEREWDTAHPRRYLYDHGVEFETFDAARETSVKLPNCYQIGTPSSNPSAMYGMWSTTDTIDLTNYSLMMMSAGLNFYRGAASGDYVVQLQGNTSKTGYNSGRVFVGLAAYGESPFYHGVDISSVNQSLYPNICAASAGCKADITEWWLE